MNDVEIVCRVCGRQKDTRHNWIDRDEEACECGAVNHYRRPDEPAQDWALNENDRRFLRSLRIVAE